MSTIRTLTDLAVALLSRAKAVVRVAVTGTLDDYDAGASTVTAAPDVSDGVPPPSVYGVPVLMPGGSLRGLTFGLAPGDRGVLLAADSGWDASWVSGAPSIPGSGLRHTYGSAALLPGGRLESEPATHAVGEMRIGAEDASATIDLRRRRGGVLGQVTITATSPVASVKLGGPLAVTPLAKAPDTTLAIVAGWTAFNAAIQADGTVAVPLKASIAAATTAAIAAVNAVPIAAVKVVAE